MAKYVAVGRQVRRLMQELSPLVDWLGLDWDDRLLDHQQTARERGRVRTASYSQIGEKLAFYLNGLHQRLASLLQIRVRQGVASPSFREATHESIDRGVQKD